MCRFKFAPMKKYICILASAALLAACEQKTETTEPMRTPLSKSPSPAASSLAPAAQASLLLVGSEARLFAIAFGAGCGKLCAGTSMTCEKAFGLCSLLGKMPRLRTIARWNMNGCVWQSALLSCFDARTGSFFHSHLSVHALAVAAYALRS